NLQANGVGVGLAVGVGVAVSVGVGVATPAARLLLLHAAAEETRPSARSTNAVRRMNPPRIEGRFISEFGRLWLLDRDGNGADIGGDVSLLEAALRVDLHREGVVPGRKVGDVDPLAVETVVVDVFP